MCIRDSWSREFSKLTREIPPNELHDKPTRDESKMIREVDNVLKELASYLSN